MKNIYRNKDVKESVPSPPPGRAFLCLWYGSLNFQNGLNLRKPKFYCIIYIEGKEIPKKSEQIGGKIMNSEVYNELPTFHTIGMLRDI